MFKGSHSGEAGDANLDRIGRVSMFTFTPTEVKLAARPLFATSVAHPAVAVDLNKMTASMHFSVAPGTVP
jgi:hypothetical protein